MMFDVHEPCMCGADDCRECYPFRRDAEWRNDEPENDGGEEYDECDS